MVVGAPLSPSAGGALEAAVDFPCPDWMPDSPDDTMRLFGQLPPHADASSVSHSLQMLQHGQRFFQYYTSSSGALVKKHILLFYVPDTAGAKGALGKLYWSERSRRSHSQTRCLPLDRISDIYLGAQTAVLKQAYELALQQSQGSPVPLTDGLHFSLLSDTMMLDLEATSTKQLCYWLWSLGHIICGAGRDVMEKVDELPAAVDLLNCSRAALSSGLDDVEGDMDENDMRLKRQTRKFSVHMTSQAEDMEEGETTSVKPEEEETHPRPPSFHLDPSTVPTHSPAQIAAHLSAPLTHVRSSFDTLRSSVSTELSTLSSFLTDSLLEVAQRSRATVRAQQALLDQLAAEQKKRKKLQNKLIEIQGNIRVFARVRPSSAEEIARGDVGAVQFTGENTLLLASGPDGTGAPKSYEFDRVYDQASTQAMVFKDVQPFVQSCVDGYNICVFAYGQTGAGKSYTMEGPPSDRGVNYRSLSELFSLIDVDNPNKTAGYNYEVTLSVVEIYNESIRDLLSDEQKNPPKLDVRQGPDGMCIPGLTEVQVHNVEQVLNLMSQKAYPNRSVASTNMNAQSSRSHCVLFVKVVGKNERTGERTAGKLVLIDLAGSERLAKSGAEGQGKKEAAAINGSLSALGTVIASIQSKQGHIPYRNSKLTHLLQDCLSGQSKCLMFCQISPAMSSVQESSCSLQFATRAMHTDLGVAKKNKTVVASDSAASKKATEALKKEGKANKDEVAKALKQAREAEDMLQNARDQIMLLKNQLREVQKEAQMAREKAQQQQDAARLALQSKEKEVREAKVQALQEARSHARKTSSTMAWDADGSIPKKSHLNSSFSATAAARRSTRQTATTSSLPTLDVDGANEDGGQENQGLPTNRGPAATRKRKSGEDLESSPISAKRQVVPVEREEIVPFSSMHAAPITRPRTAMAGRVASTPILSAGGLNTSATASAAQTARTRRQQALAQLQEKANSVAMQQAAVTRAATRTAARPATAAPSLSDASRASISTSVSADGSLDDSTAGLSVTELARRKLEERRLKYKAERAVSVRADSLTKKPTSATAASSSWKR